MIRPRFFRARALSCALFALFSNLTATVGAEPAWKRVLSGDIVSAPVAFGDRVYAQTTDRMLTCLSDGGAFLWSKPLPGKSAPFLAVSGFGLVLAVVAPGIITATNLDGRFLWQLRGSELPVCAPLSGRDGRIFVAYRSRIVCLSVGGLVKWTLPIDESATGPLSVTGSGDVLVACGGDITLRVSPYGEALETIPLKGASAAILPVSAGFVVGYENGSVRSFDVRDGRASGNASECVWEFRGNGRVAALTRDGPSIFVLFADGMLVALNVTDGAVLWNLATGIASDRNSSLSFEYGQIYGLTGRAVFAIDAKGRFLWKYALVSEAFPPRLSDSGLAYTVAPDGVLSAWRVESRIKSEKAAQKSESYGILNGKSAGYGIPEGPDRRSALWFLDSVSDEIRAGTVGSDEVHFARRLAEIMRGDTGFGPFAPQFDSSERARSATLLGRLGSSEYRQVLVDEAPRATDPTVATGILLGLAACGSDGDGRSLESIDRLVRAFPADETVLRSACDALYAVTRFSSGEASLDGTRYLARFLEDGETPGLREYARTLLGKLLE